MRDAAREDTVGRVHERSDVASMEDFLRDTLRSAEVLNSVLSQALSDLRRARDELRVRLYALQLAEDASLASDVHRLADDLGAGSRPQTFSLEAVLERQDR